MDAAESEILVPASPEEAWEAVTDPERLSEWLGDVRELELAPGGEVRVELPEGEREGFVEEVSEPSRLVFWWAAEGEESSRVEIELVPSFEQTVVRVTESRPLSDLSVADARSPELCAVA